MNHTDEGLQIEKAVCGAQDSWRDVTAFLRDNVKGDALSMTISQPFQEIGGDPAWGQRKELIIDYRLHGATNRLSLAEQYPVAFTIELGSAEALARSRGPLVSRSMPRIKANLNRDGNLYLICFACGLSLLALVCASVALGQIRGIRKQLSKNQPAG